MKHANVDTLARIEPLFVKLRRFPQLNEKKLGIFYLKSKAFLHFHEEGNELFADVRISPPEFTRICVTTKKSQGELVSAVRTFLG